MKAMRRYERYSVACTIRNQLDELGESAQHFAYSFPLRPKYVGRVLGTVYIMNEPLISPVISPKSPILVLESCWHYFMVSVKIPGRLYSHESLGMTERSTARAKSDKKMTGVRGIDKWEHEIRSGHAFP